MEHCVPPLEPLELLAPLEPLLDPLDPLLEPLDPLDPLEEPVPLDDDDEHATTSATIANAEPAAIERRLMFI